jgi:SAM-dependent methyltransferase
VTKGSDRYDHLREYYADFAHHDEAGRRVAWRCHDDQVLRFEVLLDALDDDDYPVSILDVGCGVGSLYGHLKDTDRLGEYRGLDLLPEMIRQARLAFPDGRFEVADLLAKGAGGQFDLVVCSGALNVRVKNHAIWVQKMLKTMWGCARLAVAVNFQTTRALRTNPVATYDADLFHADRATVFRWCEQLTPWVAMRQDYLDEDATFYLYKDYHRSVRRMARRRESDPRSDNEMACGLAYLLLERKLPEAALEVLGDVEPTARVLNYRGLCYHRMGQRQRARECYEAALEKDPELEEARLNLDWVRRA